MPCCEYSPIRKPGKNPVPPPGVLFGPASPPLVTLWLADIGDAIVDVNNHGLDRLGGDPTGEPKVIGSIVNKYNDLVHKFDEVVKLLGIILEHIEDV